MVRQPRDLAALITRTGVFRGPCYRNLMRSVWCIVVAIGLMAAGGHVRASRARPHVRASRSRRACDRRRASHVGRHAPPRSVRASRAERPRSSSSDRDRRRERRPRARLPARPHRVTFVAWSSSRLIDSIRIDPGSTFRLAPPASQERSCPAHGTFRAWSSPTITSTWHGSSPASSWTMAGARASPTRGAPRSPRSPSIHPMLVITDLRMPDVDGLAVVDAARHAERR